MGTLDPYSAAVTVHGDAAVYRTNSDSYGSRSNCRIGETGRLGSRDPPDLAGDTGHSSAAAEATPALFGDSDEELDEERPAAVVAAGAPAPSACPTSTRKRKRGVMPRRWPIMARTAAGSRWTCASF